MSCDECDRLDSTSGLAHQAQFGGVSSPLGISCELSLPTKGDARGLAISHDAAFIAVSVPPYKRSVKSMWLIREERLLKRWHGNNNIYFLSCREY